mmetsp:Transcript_25353/g.56357  ORF Transcript_25353/g.56357 Transcript_25353/m.56357 type:complete len:290 (-) Transcript_25353:127-996(-)
MRGNTVGLCTFWASIISAGRVATPTSWVGVRDEKLGLELLCGSTKKGYPRAVFALAKQYRSVGQLTMHDSLMEVALDQGHAMAGTLLGYDCQDGAKAVRYMYLERASELGCGMASFCLGTAYDRGGHGLERNLTAALRYYCIGSEQGEAGAQFLAARLYKEHVGDGEKEVEYLLMAAEQGYVGAQEHVGKIYVDHGGEWIKSPNWPSGVYWIRRAAAGGCEDAAWMLNDIEETTKNVCFNCGITRTMRAGEGERFGRCAKCRSAYYCSRECQRAHWGTGHKQSCVKGDA